MKLESSDYKVAIVMYSGPDLCLSSYHELKVNLLQKELQSIMMDEDHKKFWQEHTFMCDGWSDCKVIF